MTELNEYQQRANAKAVEFHDLLQPIVDQMPEGWSLQPIKLDDCGHAHRPQYIVNVATGLELMVRYDEYDIRGKFEFKAIEWPKYADENGQTCVKHPGDCYQPRETAPTTKATAGREPKAIAKQVERMLPEYERIWERCQGLAAESQKYHDATKQALDLLTEATGDDRHSSGNRRSGWYLQDYPGSQSVEFNSLGDVRIRLTTEEMVGVIDYLYRKNTGKRRTAQWFSACPECGCTDVQVGAWVVDNTEEVEGTGSEGASDSAWCPQCDINGDDGHISACHFLVQSETRQPVTEAPSRKYLCDDCGSSASFEDRGTTCRSCGRGTIVREEIDTEAVA